jgi:hypothetical protein
MIITKTGRPPDWDYSVLLDSMLWLSTKFNVECNTECGVEWIDTWESPDVSDPAMLKVLNDIEWDCKKKHITYLWYYECAMFSYFRIAYYPMHIDIDLPLAIVHHHELVVDIKDPLIALEFKLAVF